MGKNLPTTPKPTRFALRGYRGTIVYLDDGQFKIVLERDGGVVHRSTFMHDDKDLNYSRTTTEGQVTRAVMTTVESVAYVAHFRCKLYEHSQFKRVVDKDNKPLTDLAGALTFLAAHPDGGLFSTGGYSSRGDDELVTDASNGWSGVYRVTLEVKAMLQAIGAVGKNCYGGFKQYRAIYRSNAEVAARLLPDAEAIHEGRRLGMTWRAFEAQQDEYEKNRRASRRRRERFAETTVARAEATS